MGVELTNSLKSAIWYPVHRLFPVFLLLIAGILPASAMDCFPCHSESEPEAVLSSLSAYTDRAEDSWQDSVSSPISYPACFHRETCPSCTECCSGSSEARPLVALHKSPDRGYPKWRACVASGIPWEILSKSAAVWKNPCDRSIRIPEHLQPAPKQERLL